MLTKLNEEQSDDGFDSCDDDDCVFDQLARGGNKLDDWEEKHGHIVGVHQR